jgi:hypothetical protein
MNEVVLGITLGSGAFLIKLIVDKWRRKKIPLWEWIISFVLVALALYLLLFGGLQD